MESIKQAPSFSSGFWRFEGGLHKGCQGMIRKDEGTHSICS